MCDVKTSKAISTISYNTPAFLKLKLDELITSKILDEYFFIPHKPEDDEAGKKDHCHVFCVPAKMIQTSDLRDFFKEFDPANPDKPRTVLPFVSSKFSSWCLYALHDASYLASKGQSRRFHYTYDDLVSFDSDALNFRYKQIDVLSELGSFKGMEEAISHGMKFDEYFRSGRVPIQQINAFITAWQLIASNKTDRNGRPGHDEDLPGEFVKDYKMQEFFQIKFKNPPSDVDG